MAGRAQFTNWSLGLLGATIGGALGYLAFFFMTRQGFYPMVLPGALLGLGCGFLSGTKSTGLGILCGLLAVVLGLVIEWRFAPFRDDRSFSYFITHVQNLRTMTLVMIAVGAW